MKVHQKWLEACSQDFAVAENLISIFQKNSDLFHESVGPPEVAYLSPYPKFVKIKKIKESASHH